MLHRRRGAVITDGRLEAAVEEVGELFAERVEGAEETDVELVILLHELLDDSGPEGLAQDFGETLATAGDVALLDEHLLVDLLEVLGGLPGMAAHRGPHLELLDDLVQ